MGGEVWEEYVLGYRYVDGTWRTLYKHNTYGEAARALAARTQPLELSIAKVTIEVIKEVAEVKHEVV